MGVTSLPVLNKIGVLNYWQSLWSSNKFFQFNFGSTLVADHIINKITSEKNLILKTRKKIEKFDLPYYFRFSCYNDFKDNNFTGEVIFLFYSNNIVITPLIIKNFIAIKKLNSRGSFFNIFYNDLIEFKIDNELF